MNYTDEQIEILKKRKTIMLDIANIKGVANVLNNEQLGILTRIILEYANYNITDIQAYIQELINTIPFENDLERDKCSFAIQIAYSSIKEMLDRHTTDYLEKSRKAQESVNVRWNKQKDIK